jgi:hypothetical protein
LRRQHNVVTAILKWHKWLTIEREARETSYLYKRNKLNTFHDLASTFTMPRTSKEEWDLVISQLWFDASEPNRSDSVIHFENVKRAIDSFWSPILKEADLDGKDTTFLQ